MNVIPKSLISDAEFNAVRAMAAEGRPIPAIVMAALLERLQPAEDERRELDAKAA
jgi:hypothetical protein